MIVRVRMRVIVKVRMSKKIVRVIWVIVNMRMEHQLIGAVAVPAIPSLLLLRRG